MRAGEVPSFVSRQVRHRIAAGALVVENDRLLLVHHRKAERYDFWVPPGGAVADSEELSSAAAREVTEETGLIVDILELAYVDELLIGRDTRQCKFWFLARLIGGTLTTSSDAALAENIVEAAFVSRAEMNGRMVFPPVVVTDFWVHLREGFPEPRFLGVRKAVVV
jgi:8-oxo-dGTP diphosphatase